VRVDVTNDGGRGFQILAADAPTQRVGSRIGLFVLGPTPRLTDEKPVRVVRWGRQPRIGAPLITTDANLAAGYTWHAEYAFAVEDAARLARITVQLQLRQLPTRLRRGVAEIVGASTDTITGRDERSTDGPSPAPDARSDEGGARHAAG